MKYLVLGPACMAIFSLIGGLKAMESDLAGVEEISGSSAGSILALFLAVGMSVDEILETALSVNINDYFRIKLSSFFTEFGFVDVAPIREKLVEICGSDPTFAELEMKIYVSAFCLNTSETVYFSRDTHPNMKVIDAVCMSMAVPLIFSCGKYMGNTYVDGGTKEEYPLPFHAQETARDHVHENKHHQPLPGRHLHAEGVRGDARAVRAVQPRALRQTDKGDRHQDR